MAYAKILGEKFDLIDKNHDGKLSKEEIQNFLVVFGFKKQDAEGFIKAFDSDKDGSISRDEFMKAVGKDKSNKFPEAQLRALFRKADKDNSGKITAKELKQFLDEFHNIVAPEDVKKWIHQHDRDGDKKLDYEEFLTLLNKHM